MSGLVVVQFTSAPSELDMVAKVEMNDAKGRLEELVARARAGEEIVLAEGGKAVARITSAAAPQGVRVFGEFAGKVWISDDFSAPLTDEDLAEWEK